MNSIYLSGVRELCERPFTVENISVIRARVTPPATFKCTVGHLSKSRFFYVVRGCIVLNDGKHNCVKTHASEILYLPSDVEYVSRWQTDAEGEFITFNCNLLSPAGDDLLLGHDVFVICRDKAKKQFDRFAKICEYFIANSRSSHFKMLALFYAFLGDMVDEHERSIAKSDEVVSPIYKGIVYINKNYCSKIPVQQAAALCNMSESTFRRKFFTIFGMQPHAYIDNLKIQKAKELLQSGAYNVNEVADFLGFYDASHFHKFFKKHCGIAPGEY